MFFYNKNIHKLLSSNEHSCGCSNKSSDDESNKGGSDSEDSDRSSTKSRHKKQEPAWAQDPEMYGVRRSTRDRQVQKNQNTSIK